MGYRKGSSGYGSVMCYACCSQVAELNGRCLVFTMLLGFTGYHKGIGRDFFPSCVRGLLLPSTEALGVDCSVPMHHLGLKPGGA